MRGDRIRTVACFAVAVAQATLVACSRPGPAGPAAPPPAPVTVARAEKQGVPVELRAIGNVEASSVVEVRARVAGELERVQFEEGRIVAKGDPLFTLDRKPFEVALAQAEAKLARDQVLARNAREEVDRYAELVQKEYVTREQYDRSAAAAAAAEAQVRADEAEVERARLDLGYCTIVAPIAGRAGAVLLRPGNLVKASADEPLVVLRRTRPIFVSFAIPEGRLAEVRARSAAGSLEVAAYPRGVGSEPRVGVLSFVDNTVDGATGTIRLKGTFPNADDALWPGQFVDVVLRLAVESDAVTVPARAVQSGQQGEYVFVVRPDGTVESRPVRVTRRHGDAAVVGEGVAPGETVVTEGQLRLVPGSRVAVKEPS